MEKREFDAFENRNKELLKDIDTLEREYGNPTDRVEVVTEKDAAQYIPAADKISSNGRKNNTLGKFSLEATKKDVEEELTKAKNRLNELEKLAEKHHVSIDSYDSFVKDIEEKVSELYEKLKEIPLTNEEFSDLINYTRELNFTELVRDYYARAALITARNIQKLERVISAGRVSLLFVPTMTKLKEKLGFKTQEVSTENQEYAENFQEHIASINDKTKAKADEIERNINEIYDSFFESLVDCDLNGFINNNYTNEDLEKLLKETDKLKKRYDEVNDRIKNNNNLDYIESSYIKKEIVWNKYINSLSKTFKMLQTMHLKNCYDDINKYKTNESTREVIKCKIGNQVVSISKKHFVDDVANFYKILEEYKRDSKQNDEKNEFGSLETLPLEPVNDIKSKVENEDNIDEELEKEKLKAKQRKLLEQLPSIDIEPTPEPLPEPEPTPMPENEEEPKEDKVEDFTQLPIIDMESPIIESNKIAEKQEKKSSIISSKQAYIEFMSCFIDREEAKVLATPQNIDTFETSNIGVTKYTKALDAGEINSDTTYRDFVMAQIEAKGLKYDQPVKTKPSDNKESDEILNNSNFEIDLSGFDVIGDDPMQFTDDSDQFSPKIR